MSAGAPDRRQGDRRPGAQREAWHGAEPAGAAFDWPRTLMARGADTLRAEHLHRRPQETRTGALHCFVLDCSASMAAGGKLARAKGVLLALMDEAYRRRDRVALLCFGGDSVELRMPPQRASAWNEDWIAPIASAGGTPVALGLRYAAQLLAREAAQQRWLWLLTDGRTTETPPRPDAADRIAVLDFESQRGALHRAEALAGSWMPCAYLRPDEAAT